MASLLMPHLMKTMGFRASWVKGLGILVRSMTRTCCSQETVLASLIRKGPSRA